MNKEINEPDTFKPNHYHSQPFNSSLVQETIFLNMATDPSPVVMLRAMWTSYAVKHLLRCGLKDDINTELKKAENYLHKARTREWLKDE
jgi:hypothetical protein